MKRLKPWLRLLGALLIFVVALRIHWPPPKKPSGVVWLDPPWDLAPFGLMLVVFSWILIDSARRSAKSKPPPN